MAFAQMKAFFLENYVLFDLVVLRIPSAAWTAQSLR